VSPAERLAEKLERLQQFHPLAGDPDEQYTPTEDFEPLNREFQFTLDPAATAESAKCPKFYTVLINGLLQSWAGERVFLNPPYSQIDKWLEKVRQEMANGCQCVAALLPAWTDRKWWHRFVGPTPNRDKNGPEVRFLEGRIKFGCPGDPEGELDEVFGEPRSTGTFPSVVIIWRAKGLVIPDPRQIDWVKAQDGARGQNPGVIEATQGDDGVFRAAADPRGDQPSNRAGAGAGSGDRAGLQAKELLAPGPGGARAGVKEAHRGAGTDPEPGAVQEQGSMAGAGAGADDLRTAQGAGADAPSEGGPAVPRS